MAKGIRGPEARTGWLFTAPAVLIIGLFLVLPILLALYVSFGDWNGRGSPLGRTEFTGLDNYQAVIAGGAEGTLSQRDFGTSIRNNLYYVIGVVPAQTALALFLAVQVNRRLLRGRGFFRTAFYFPSVTSSIAITTIFIFLFSASGAVNSVIRWLGVNGPNWFSDPRGVLHLLLGNVGVGNSGAIADGGMLGLTWYEWLSGPSVAMCVLVILAVFTTSGTFMLLFLAALQNVSGEVQEAASIDGAGPVRTFFSVTLPLLKPTVFTVLTLGLIGTWQVFDQVYLTGGGDPGKTTLTPAFLAYQTSFGDLDWGEGAAIAFLLFLIIVFFTLIQRWVLRDRDLGRAGARREKRAVERLRQDAAAARAGDPTAASATEVRK
ncbi:carbohydrate ABC transporter permease [Pseudolysinimonas sp.]